MLLPPDCLLIRNIDVYRLDKGKIAEEVIKEMLKRGITVKEEVQETAKDTTAEEEKGEEEHKDTAAKNAAATAAPKEDTNANGTLKKIDGGKKEGSEHQFQGMQREVALSIVE